MPKTTVLQDSKRKCSVFQLVQQLPNTSNRSAFFITSYYLQLLCGNYLQLLCGNYLQLLCGNYLQLLCGKLLRELLSTQDFQLNQPQLNQQPLLPTVPTSVLLVSIMWYDGGENVETTEMYEKTLELEERLPALQYT